MSKKEYIIPIIEIIDINIDESIAVSGVGLLEEMWGNEWWKNILVIYYSFFYLL